MDELKLRSSRLSIRPAMFDFFKIAWVVLCGRIEIKELAIIYSTSHVWFSVRCGKGAGKGKVRLTLSSCSFWPSPTLLVQFPFDSRLPQKSNVAAIITRHSPAKITPFETFLKEKCFQNISFWKRQRRGSSDNFDEKCITHCHYNLRFRIFKYWG